MSAIFFLFLETQMSDALVMLRLKSIQTEANNIADELTRKTGTNDPRVWRKLYPNEYFLVKRKIAEYETEMERITGSIQNKWFSCFLVLPE